MVRRSLELSDGTAAKLDRLAREQGVPVAHLIRDALSQLIGREELRGEMAGLRQDMTAELQTVEAKMDKVIAAVASIQRSLRR